MLCSVNSRMHVFLLQFINFEIETNPTIRAILQLLWVWIEKLSSCRKDLCLLLPLTGGTINLSPCTLYSLSRSFWTTLVNSYFSDLHKHCLYGSSSQGACFPPTLICCQGWDKQALLLSLSMVHMVIIFSLWPFGSLLYMECSVKLLY